MRATCRLVVPAMPVGSGPQGKPFLSRRGSAQTIVAVVVAAEVEVEPRMLARQMYVGKVVVAEAAAADGIEVEGTLWTASARCGIVAVARSLE